MANKLFTSQTIKRFTSVHSWVGIVCGIALFIAFFCGAFTMYEKDIHRWANPGIRTDAGSPAQLDAFVAVVGRDPAAAEYLSISMGPDGEGPLQATMLSMQGDDYKDITRSPGPDQTVRDQPTPSGIAHFINELHFTLGIPGVIGYTLLGLISAAYALALVSGLIIHLPHLVKDLYGFRRTGNLKKMWTDGHNVVGILSLPFHLMFAFTATLFCIAPLMSDAMSRAMPSTAVYEQYLATSGQGESGDRGGRDERPLAAAMLPASELVARARKVAPGLRITGLSYEGYGTAAATVTVEGSKRGAMAPVGSVRLSAATGAIASVKVPGHRNGVDALTEAYIHLHEGDFGGELLRGIYFLLGLAGAFLFYSGNLLWIETRRKRRVDAQPRRTRIVAQLSIGGCLGCCLGVGVALLGARWLPEALPTHAAWEQRLCFLGFFGAIAWSLLRHPARAAVEVLGASALAFAMLPVVDLVIAAQGVPGPAARWDASAIKLDLVFLASAVGFFALARATRRRSLHGQANSVWSLRSDSAR